MFTASQIIILGLLTLGLWGLGPYLMIRWYQKLNQHSTPKKSLKWNLIAYFMGSLMMIANLALTMYTNNISVIKSESKPIPAPRIETKAEYYYKKGTKYTTDGIKYALTADHQPYLNSQGKWMLHQVGEIEAPEIERTYTFFGLNGLDKCQYPDKVPKDLAPFVREPFDNWYYTAQMQPYRGIGSEVDYYSGAYFHINVSSNKDSVFRSLEGGYNNSFVRSNHTVEMEYEGPQFLLEQDQDFYVNEIECPLQQERAWQEGKTALYYLHFNPKQQYITLYTEKMHTKNN